MRFPQKVPPIWFMRQAGRYHRHYQNLRTKYSFMQLCKEPELAAQVALGPIKDFDFDVAILFSDILFPLEALGMGLDYSQGGPELNWQLRAENIHQLRSLDDAIPSLLFQKEALIATRKALPSDKSLIGFVGGPWTLFAYAVQGKHEGGLTEAKKGLGYFESFCERLVPLLIENIQLQIAGGAEIVMVFDTAAGELSSDVYKEFVVPQLMKLAYAVPQKLGYYSKGTQQSYFSGDFFKGNFLAGLGFDHRWPLATKLKESSSGFIQGNFDQGLLFSDDFKKYLGDYLKPICDLPEKARAGWVCGLGHGVLPQTPEKNVKAFVEIVREKFAQ
jgi:uroporphyrinogen decarboxylase